MKKHIRLSSAASAKSAALTLLAASASLCVSHAAVVLSYDGNAVSYVSGTDVTAAITPAVATTGVSPNETITRSIAFSDSTVWSPSSGYTGPAVYLGFSAAVTNNGTGTAITSGQFGIGRNQIRNDSNAIASFTADSVAIQGGFTSLYDGDSLSAQYFTVLKNPSTPFALDGLSARWSAGLSAAATGYTPTARFAVQVDDQYYLSSATNTNGNFSLSGTTLTSATWAAYNPTLNINFDAAATFGSISLTSIQAVGLYVEDDSYTMNSATNTNGFNLFVGKLEASAIPEPSAYGVLVGFFVLGMVAIRRRRL